MRLLLKWPNCNYHSFKDETVFWVEATLEELEENVYHQMTNEDLGAFIKDKRDYSARDNSDYLTKNSFYFLVDRDCTKFQIERWTFPYGGMWNAGNPFMAVDQKEIQSIIELKQELHRIN